MRTQRSFALTIAITMAFAFIAAPVAFAGSTCWCEIASSYSTGEHDTSVISLTNAVNTTYCAGPGCLCKLIDGNQCDKARADCSQKCNLAADPYRNNPGAFCAKGTTGPTRNGVTLRAYSHVGTRGWEANDTIGTLTNVSAVVKTTYDCNGLPGTWLDNPTTGNGNHARCVKNSCNAVGGVPVAPAWTSIGTGWSSATAAAWVTDGTGNIWYGVPAHATTTIVQQAQCHF